MSKLCSMFRWGTMGALAVALGGPAVAHAQAPESAGQAADQAAKSANQAAQSAGQAAQSAGQSAAGAAQNAGETAAGATRSAGETVQKGGAAVSDATITTKIKGKLASEGSEASTIDVNTENGVVTLSGTVSAESTRTSAVKAAKGTSGVATVNDLIDVKPGQNEKQNPSQEKPQQNQ